MAIRDWFKRTEEPPVEERSVSDLLNPQEWLLEWLTGGPTDAGEPVNPETALKFSAVYASVNIISQSVGSIPICINRVSSDGKKEKAQDHPLFRLLWKAPNEEHSRHEFFSFVMQQILLYGNSYSVIERNNGGRIVSLVPLCTTDVMVRVVDPNGKDTNQGNGRIVFDHVPSQTRFERRDILFVRNNMTLNGITGISPITYARQNVGIALAAEKYGARFFKNSARPGGILSSDQKISPEHQEALKEQFKKFHQGSANAHKMLLLPQGLQFTPMTLPPEDAAFIATRRLEIEEIARIYRVPPHLLQDLSRSTNNNIEQQSLDFLHHTIQPWLSIIEGAIERDLFSQTEKNVLELDFKTENLVRVDAQTRAASTALEINSGLLTVNEGRAALGRNPVEDGDKVLVSVQAQPLKMLLEPPKPAPAPVAPSPPEEEEEEDAERSSCEHADESRAGEVEPTEERALPERVKLADSVAPFFRAAAQKLLDYEVPRIKELVANHRDNPAAFADALVGFYENHRSELENIIRPTYENFTRDVVNGTKAELKRADDIDFSEFLTETIAATVFGWSERSRQVLAQDWQEQDGAELVGQRLSEWEESRAEVFANEQHVKQQNRVARFAMMAMGITALVWRTRGGCELCKPLDGKVVGIRSQFVRKGETHHGENGTSITAKQNTRHAPLHKGCQCYVEAQ